MLCLLCSTAQAADNNKVLSEENKEWFEKILKQPTLCHFKNKTRQQSLLHSIRKVSEMNCFQTA